ncbi:PepSY domain-containing protein [Parashewanella spongiae]|nr:PepSY domain-containing protein [Parashewanella spongiae]MCL1077020.1 PepSY domain-containing protein [Parashewanella spongiae]
MWRKLHRYLTLIVGLPFLSWLLSGLAFNLFSDNALSGRTHFQITPIVETKLPCNFNLQQTLSQLNVKRPQHSISKIRLSQSLGRSILIIKSKKISLTDTQYLWADTLLPIELTQQQLLELAKASYRYKENDDNNSNKVTFSTPELLPEHFSRFRNEGSTHHNHYLVQVNDRLKTRIYLNGNTAKVLAHLNQQSDVKDILFAFHFFDFDHDNGLAFNHWFIRVVAVLTLLLAISGTVILYRKLKLKFQRVC